MAQPSTETRKPALLTPDGRYIVVRGRLWRTSDPQLNASERQRLVNDLMLARRDIAAARRENRSVKLTSARARANAAKCALGERGPVWWTDGAPDLNRHMVHTTPYRTWHSSLTEHSCSHSPPTSSAPCT